MQCIHSNIAQSPLEVFVHKTMYSRRYTDDTAQNTILYGDVRYPQWYSIQPL